MFDENKSGHQQQTLPYGISSNRQVVEIEDSSSESDDELFMQKIKQKVEMEMHEEENDGQIPRTKNERVIQISTQEIESREQREQRYTFNRDLVSEMIDAGEVESITRDSIVVYRGFQNTVLNLDLLILTQDKQIIGPIDDVFGKIEVPHYRILKDGFNQQLIEQGLLKIGTRVYLDKKDQRYLSMEQLQQLMRKKGCDASNQYDEEIDENDDEFSDDDNESVSKSKKKKNKQKDNQKDKAQQEKQKPYRPRDPNFHRQEYQQPRQPPQQQQYQQQPLCNPVFQQQLQKGPVQQYIQIGQQYFNLLPNGIPNLLQPKSEKPQ